MRGAGIDGGAAGHAHRCGCGRGLRSGLQQRVSAALPVAPHQHRAAAGRPRGADAAAALQLNAVALQADVAAFARCLGAAGIQGSRILHTRAARQHNAPALLLKTSGFHRATVFHHAADQAVHRLRADDDQAARGLYGQAVVHQGLNLAGRDAQAGQAVVAVELQVKGFASGHGHGAHVRDDGTLVAHLRGEQGDVAAQCGLELAFVDHAGGAVVALKPVFARHEVGIANAMCGRDQTAHIDARIFAKKHARRVGEDDLAVGRDLAKDLAGVVAEHTVERDAAGTGLYKLHLGVFAHIEALPIDGRAVGALLDEHIRTRLPNACLTRADLSARGQGGGWWCRLGVGALRQKTPQNCSNG